MKPTTEAIEAAIRYLEAPMSAREQMERILTAAYAAQFPPSEDYAALIRTLRSGLAYKEKNNRAADALEAVLADRDALKDLLPNQNHESRAPIPTDWWSVAVLERRKRLAAEKERAELALAVSERDALLARLAPVEDEALVEIAAKIFGTVLLSKLVRDFMHDDTKKAARAAIAAIRPHIEAAERERCAKAVKTVAKKINVAPHERPAYEDGYLQGVHDAAAAIRSGK